jgi:hypothetical protein
MASLAPSVSPGSSGVQGVPVKRDAMAWWPLFSFGDVYPPLL